MLLTGFQSDGVVRWPLAEVALLRDEWEGRLEATHRTGEVAWLPGPLPDPPTPLHLVSPGTLVNPAHARQASDGLHLPGGWTLPAAPLPAPAPPLPEDPDEALALDYRQPDWVWLTRSGERPGPPNREEALRQYPDLVRTGYWYVRPGAVRRVQRVGDRARVVLSSGVETHVMWNSLRPLAQALGVGFPDLLETLPERHRPVYQRGFRDWPKELLLMEPPELAALAQGDALRLVDLALWQLQRLVAQGRNPGYGPTPRGLYYNPMLVLATRAGLDPHATLVLAARAGLEPDATPLLRWFEASLPRATGAAEDRLWSLVQSRLELFVGTWRYCTYQGLGCVDRGEANRRVGGARPHVVLLVEKESLEPDARRLAELFDVSLLVLGGAPTYIALEFLAEALRGRVDGPILLVSFCDFDPYGWHFPVATARMLERYGAATAGIHRLVHPSRFTPEELDRIALPLRKGSLGRPEVERWMAETGGVRGLPLGIYADYLRPFERLVLAFQQATGLRPL